MKIPLSSPDITDIEVEYVNKILRSRHLSLGPELQNFEDDFSKYLGTKYAIAVNSGTSGLHILIKAMEIGPKDHVLTTPFSFIASANCILFENAIPLFVDIDEDTLNIDANKVRDEIEKKENRNKSIKAVLPVHVFGVPCEMDDLLKIAKDHNLKIIEDSCEAIGTEYKGKKVGGIGHAGVFAFYPNKQITTGEGGMIVTDDHDIYEMSKSLRNQGRDNSQKWLSHVRIGYNYRLSDINCALGRAQLSRIEEILDKRNKVAFSYYERLKGVEQIVVPNLRYSMKQSWFVYVITLNREYNKDSRDSIMSQLKERGIACNNYFTPIHLQPFYMEKFGFKHGDFPVTESVSERTIALPFFNNLAESDIDYITENLKQILNR